MLQQGGEKFHHFTGKSRNEVEDITSNLGRQKRGLDRREMEWSGVKRGNKVIRDQLAYAHTHADKGQV